jgi:hypothetical protein
MQYNGKYNIFDFNKINTYPLGTRSNKVTLDDLVRPMDIENITMSTDILPRLRRRPSC